MLNPVTSLLTSDASQHYIPWHLTLATRILTNDPPTSFHRSCCCLMGEELGIELFAFPVFDVGFVRISPYHNVLRTTPTVSLGIPPYLHACHSSLVLSLILCHTHEPNYDLSRETCNNLTVRKTFILWLLHLLSRSSSK
jgi:hypothetical protein